MDTTNKNSWFALLSAVILHLVFLSIQWPLETPNSIPDTKINLTLITEQPAPEKPPPRLKTNPPPIEKSLLPANNPVVQEPVVEQPVVEEPAPKIQWTIIVANPNDNTAQEPRLSVDVSTTGELFKQFLKSETDKYSEENPQVLSEFGKTFKPTPRQVNVVTATSKDGQAQIIANGVGMSEDKNGKRTCFARVPNILDENAPPGLLSKDCTPEKKFILDLDRPINY